MIDGAGPQRETEGAQRYTWERQALNQRHGSFFATGETVGRIAKKTNKLGGSWEEGLKADKIYSSVASILPQRKG